MPKQPKTKSGPSLSVAGPSRPSKAGKKSGEIPAPSSSTAGSSNGPKLYSSFLPIPTSLPSPVPIPSSSSSKAVNSATHYIYARPHTAKAGSSKDVDLPLDRTVFLANLPVDLGERGLRAICGKWGVVERVVMGDRGDGDALENAVRGMEVEDEDDEDDSDADHGEGEEVGPNGTTGAGRAEPTFLGDPTLPTRRKRRREKLPASVPDIVTLPALNPRSDPFGPSGLRAAHVIYLDAVSVSRLMSFSGPALAYDPAKDTSNPSGLGYYLSLYAARRPPLGAVKTFADSAMARFDHLHSLLLSSRAKQAGAGALVDEDGFTLVVRGGAKHSRTGGIADRMGRNVASVGVAGKGFGQAGYAGGKAGKKEARGGAKGELPDFYKFQKMDRKRQELADLRTKFEEDKKKVEEMKRARRFKPY